MCLREKERYKSKKKEQIGSCENLENWHAFGNAFGGTFGNAFQDYLQYV